MADLNPLIRLRKHGVEQKQKILARLYAQSQALTEEKDALLEQLREEQDKITDMEPEMQQYFGPYAARVRHNVEGLEEKIRVVEVKIDKARESMRVAFAELKKIEITQERREDALEAAARKKESQDLDEIAIANYLRKIQDD